MRGGPGAARMGTARMGTAAQRMGTARLGTAAGGVGGEARPMTSIRGAGYTSAGKPPGTAGDGQFSGWAGGAGSRTTS